MKIKPLGKRVVLKKIERGTEEEEGGIILPEEAKEEEKYLRGEVVAVGSDDKIEVKKGDEVIVSSYSGTELTVGGEEVTIVKDNDILAIVE